MSQFPNPPGSYAQTSRDITFTANTAIPGSYILAATTQRANGSWTKSEMEFGITNNDGKLQWAPQENKGGGYQYPDVPNGLPAGTYLLSSSDVKITDNRGGGAAPFTLTAQSKDRKGQPQAASLDYDIANCDGKLVFNPKYGC